jgi:type II secretory pathway pseudopilin PulG
MKKEDGFILIAVLLVISILTVLSLGAMMYASTGLAIAGNDRSAKQVFYLAESGLEEGRSRLASNSLSPITDSLPTDKDWKLFIGTLTRAQSKGFNPTSPKHFRVDSLNPSLDYIVVVIHKLNSSNQVLLWDGANESTAVGNNLYVVTSEGYGVNGAVKAMQTEVSRLTLNFPAALYAKDRVNQQGKSIINGLDPCGAVNKPGVLTMSTWGHTGEAYSLNGEPDKIENSPLDYDVLGLITKLQKKANYTLDGSKVSGGNWGNIQFPNGRDQAAGCADHNIVYIKGNVTLTGHSQGCGILLVEGDFTARGGFEWYGPILVSGEISFLGGGGPRM